MKEIKEIIKEYKLGCTVQEFIDNKDHVQDRVDWSRISAFHKLSEPFIEKFKDNIDWYNLSRCQKLSESFIEKHSDKVGWINISYYQKLSEKFIEKNVCKIALLYISICQKLSEKFIEKHKNILDLHHISYYQKLSEKFIEKHSDKLDVNIQRKNHKEKSYEQKLKEATSYAKKHKLKINKTYLYAFRDHDNWGRGSFNKTIFYEKGTYYRDWHCDMDKNEKNSFGLGIWPKGNTPVKVKIKDWGVEVVKDKGKARVWGFEII